MLTTLLTIALWIFIALAAIYLIFWVDMAIVFFVSFIKHKKEMKQIRKKIENIGQFKNGGEH